MFGGKLLSIFCGEHYILRVIFTIFGVIIDKDVALSLIFSGRLGFFSTSSMCIFREISADHFIIHTYFLFIFYKVLFS